MKINSVDNSLNWSGIRKAETRFSGTESFKVKNVETRKYAWTYI